MKQVLIVDDQADLRKLLRWSLDEFEDRLELHEASNGTAALEKAEEVKPDLVLLDVMMPGELNGLQVCRRLRDMPVLQGTRVVLLSARAQATDIQEGMAAGADAYMVKPFSPQRLIETVQRLLPDL
ncbi:response regulator transcription factor [Azohydromonas lata]|uniref:Response regulator n=1 Tax=Azohydromonas lata TaxID=45677 RepID=A0ABU5IP34_9BURK|nr:response regulator [Azohydromonas lata]MDZ5460637.1 response regulator [Azohydromonas lata]